MIVEGNLNHYDDIVSLIGEKEIGNKIIVHLYSQDYKFILEENMQALLLACPIDDYKLNLHVFSKEGFRGKKLKDFLMEAKEHLLTTSTHTVLLGFVKESDVHLRYFLNSLGAEKLGTVKKGLGEENCILYISTREGL